MKKTKFILSVFIILTMIIFFLSALPPNGIATFTNTGNPLIPYNDDNNNPLQVAEGERNSSDPAVCVVRTHDGEFEELLMVTSCDLPDKFFDNDGDEHDIWANYPMNAIYLYGTHMTSINPNVDYMTKWYDYGPVLTETDLVAAGIGATQDSYCVWAPDILATPDRHFYLYVPFMTEFDFTTGDGIKKIAVAKAKEDGTNPYAGFDILGIFTGVNNDGYAYDPGAFCDYIKGEGRDPVYYMTYCNGPYPDGRICISVMNNNMTGASDDKGEILFTNADNSDVDGAHFQGGRMYRSIGQNQYEQVYMEGPDISEHPDGEGGSFLILTFAAKMVPGNGQLNNQNFDPSDQTEYIGYATANRNDFRANSNSCWEFKGWLSKDIGNGWTNHSNLIYSFHTQKNYYFYQEDQNMRFLGFNPHPGFNEPMYEHNRRTYLEEVPITQTRAEGLKLLPPSIKNKGLKDYISPFAYSMDESYTENNRTKVRMFLRNPTLDPWSNFKVKYYFTVENGKIPWVDDYWTPNSTLSLEHLGSDQWAVVLDYNGFTLADKEMIAEETGGEFFGLQYTDWSNFNKSNDYSQPYENFFTMKDSMSIFNSNNEKIYGTSPFNKIRNQYYENEDVRLLTASSTDEDKDVLCQDEDITWNSQDWIIESIPDSRNVRLKNLYSGKYLTVKSTAEDAKVVCQSLHTDWASQIWIMKKTEEGDYRFQNAWHEWWTEGKYLTEVDENGDSSVLCKTLHEDWSSQRWRVEQSNK